MKNIHYSLWLLPLLFLLNKGEPTPAMPENYALFFAAKDYQEWSSLRNPIRDAEAVAQKLESEFGFTTDIVRNPTKRQIQLKLNDYLTRKFNPEDQLLVFFTGHGEFNTLTNQGYFIPVDGKKNDPFHESHLSFNTLKPTISSIPCEHILLTIDACYSGSIDEALAMGGWKNDEDKKKTWKRPGVNANNAKQQFISTELKKRSRLFLTSGGIERTNDGIDHSPFTEALLAALSGDGLNDDILTFGELEGTMTDGNLQPKPRTGHFNRHQRDGNFLLIRDAVAPIDTRNYAQRQADVADFERAKQADTFTSYTEYLDKHPQGSFRREAQTRQIELADETDWKYAQLKGTATAYKEYLQRHPNGKYANQARQYANQSVPSTTRTPSTTDLPDMVFIQGGTFQMGDQFGDGYEHERPVHNVTVSDFHISNHEVTNAELAAFLNDKGNQVVDGMEWYETGSSDAKIEKSNGRYSPKQGYENHAAIEISWYGAVVYCNWKSEQSGLQKVYTISRSNVSANWKANGYRLPTEAEWEYAARSRGTKEKWSGTSTKLELSKYSNDDGADDGYSITAPVKSFLPNDLGLYDMSGNVREWCWDWYAHDYYIKIKNVQDPTGPSTGSDRVNRGGSWYNPPLSCRVASRHYNTPAGRTNFVGFRLASSAR